jgi:ribosomal protein L37AE/L43A
MLSFFHLRFRTSAYRVATIKVEDHSCPKCGSKEPELVGRRTLRCKKMRNNIHNPARKQPRDDGSSGLLLMKSNNMAVPSKIVRHKRPLEALVIFAFYEFPKINSSLYFKSSKLNLILLIKSYNKKIRR